MAQLPVRQVRLKTFTAEYLNNTSGARGDIYYDITANTLRVFNGSGNGGSALARGDLANVSNATFAAKAVSASVGTSLAWNSVTGKPVFAAVATSGNYNDLSNIPTTLTGNIFTNLIDSSDSSAITVIPATTFNSDVSIENDLAVTGTITATVREVTGGVAPPGFSPVYYNPTTREFILVSS
jgi:hypothetical protein